jgi:hypothetical protein
LAFVNDASGTVTVEVKVAVPLKVWLPVNVPAAEVRVDVAPANPTIHVEPSPVDVRVEPAVVTVEAPNVTVSPEVSVKLPDRETVTEITRDKSGAITRTVQLETTKE